MSSNAKRGYAVGGTAKRAQRHVHHPRLRSFAWWSDGQCSSEVCAASVGCVKETGYIDVAAADYVLDTTGSVTLLNTVAQGAAVTQRVGKKIVMKGLQCRGNLQNGSTANSNDVAFMIVYDKRPTGALPTVSDILVSASSSAMNNDANTGRFSILKRHDDILIGNLTAAANWTEATVKKL